MRHVSLAVAVVVSGLVACRTDSTLQPDQPALNALIVDGAHAGNPNFFFLPPLVPSPVGTANYDAGKFNASLSPFVEVCELTGDPRLVTGADCVSPTVRAFGPAKMALDAGAEQYLLNWDTKASLLNSSAFYRIIVRGAPRGTPLGVLDLDPVTGGMKNIRTGDVYAFQDGRTLPIKVRIEQGAFGSTNSNDFVEQVVPSVLPPAGLDVTTNTGFAGAHFSNGFLPPGIDQVVVIIERIAPNCLNTPLEQLEGCYRFRTDPDLHGLGSDGQDLLFAVPVIAGMCFQYPGDVGHSNEHPFEIMRSEEVGGIVTPAVPLLDEVPAPFLHCDGFGATPPSIGAAFRSGRVGDIAKAGLYAVTHAIGRAIQPEALHAVDFGAGGSTNEFSRFGYARDAFVTVTSGNGESATAGSTIDAAVRVQSIHHDDTIPVVGQSVTFTVTAGGGTVSTPSCSEGTSCSANTSSDGFADVTWRLGTGVNTIQVTTSYVTNSPQTITATGTASTFTVQTLQTGLQYPEGLWVGNGSVYVTETADHNTTFGGRRRLSRYVIIGGLFQTLIDNPVNSDAVVANANDVVYLASYVGSIPGNSGKVSEAHFDVDLGWVETPVATVATAARDMFMDANENIYVLGPNDAGANLYRLNAGNYGSPELLESGLGRSWGLTLLNGDTYYSVITGEVRILSDGANNQVFAGGAPTSLATDGTFLYYGDTNGSLQRRNLSTGAVEVLFSGPGEITAVRYDPEEQFLYFLRSGTDANHFLDGSLNRIFVGVVIP